MPDSTIISASVTVDASALQGGWEQALGINQSALAQLKASYKIATDDARTSINNLVAAQRMLGTSAQSGSQQAVAALRAAADAAADLASKQGAAKSAVDSMSAALAKEATSANQVASSIRAIPPVVYNNRFSVMGNEAAHAVTQLQATQAAIRVFDGAMPIRAVERLITMIPGIGSVLQYAFPLVGAVALGEMLFSVGEKVHKLYLNFIELKEVEEQVQAVEERLASATITTVEQTQRLAVQHLEANKQYVDAANLALQNLQSKPVDLGKFLKTEEIDKKLKQLPDGMREEFHRTFTSVIPSDIAAMTARLKAAVAESIKSAAGISTTGTAAQAVLSATPGLGGLAGGIAGGLTERQVNQQKARVEIYSGLLQYLQAETQQYAGETVVATDKVGEAHDKEAQKAEEAARKVAAAYRSRETEIAKADHDRMTDLELSADKELQTGLGLLFKKQDLIEREIAAEQQYTDRVRTLRTELAGIRTQEVRAEEEAATKAAKAQDEATRKQEQAVKKQAEAVKKQIELADEFAKANLKIAQSIVDESAKHEKQGATSDDDKRLEQLQTQKVSTQASQSVEGSQLTLGSLNPVGNSQKVNDLARIQQEDQAILAEKISFEKQLAGIELNAANQSPEGAKKEEYLAKYQEALDKEGKLETQANQQRITQSAQMLKQLEAGWQSYFNTINQGFIQGLNGWISGSEKFSQAMRQMLVKLLEQFADYYAELALKDLESWAMKKINSTGYQTMQQAQDAGRVAQAATTEATISATTSAANLSKVISYGAVAASAAFADNVDLGIPAAMAFAATAYATDVGTYGPLAAFETGGVIPGAGAQLIIGHGGEAVLPAGLTNLLMGAAGAKSSTTTTGGNSVAVHTTVNNQGLTDSAYKAMATRHSTHIVNSVMRGLRQNNVI